MYHSQIPTIVNFTILNGMGVTGWLADAPEWRPNTDRDGAFIEVSIDHSTIIWPWTGYLAVRISVKAEARSWTGMAEGIIVFTVISPAVVGTRPNASIGIGVSLSQHCRHRNAYPPPHAHPPSCPATSPRQPPPLFLAMPDPALDHGDDAVRACLSPFLPACLSSVTHPVLPYLSRL